MGHHLLKTIGMTFLLICASFPARAGNLEPFTSIPVPEQNPQTPGKIELGKKLFFDRRLSGDGTMSCETCHDPEHADTDGLDISLSYPTTRNRNPHAGECGSGICSMTQGADSGPGTFP
jgi:cytochrome c peroxidase